MKLIISHDVDILYASDHLRDLLMIKRGIRSAIECALGYASAKDAFARLVDIVKNRIHRLPELIDFDRRNHVRSTFFFGMANGMYLNYSIKDAADWIARVRQAGLSVGVHGVEYDNLKAIQAEHDAFKEITGLDRFGIRMHYLRMDDNTLQRLAHAGYVFDSSVEKLESTYKIGGMREFPLHIMDASLFFRNARWTNTTFEQAREITLQIFKKAFNLGIPYLSINLHDPNFSPAYPQIYKWYIWLVRYAKENRIAFSDFMSAVSEMENRNGSSL